MQVTIDINGRKALPIRAISYATSWRESPDSIARTLAAPKTKKLRNGLTARLRHNELFAYQIDAHGKYEQIPPSQWESVVVTLDSLTKKSQADEREDAENENHASWRIKAILELPDNVFCWLDEFQTWYSSTRPLTCDDSDFADIEYATSNDDDDVCIEHEDDTLCLSPLFPPEIEYKVWRYPKDFVPTTPNESLGHFGIRRHGASTDVTATSTAENHKKSAHAANTKIKHSPPNSLSAFPGPGYLPEPDFDTLFFGTGELPGKAPYWFFWRNKPTVELWQACVLAFNVAPEEVITKRHFDPNPDTYHVPVSEGNAQKLNQLMKLLKAHEFEMPFSGFSNGLRLRDFAIWCVQIGCDIPPELAALAKDAPQAEPDTTSADDAPAPKVEAVRGITKSAVINAFHGLHFDRNQWSKYTATTPEWLKACRVQRGDKRTSALWNPVDIGIALLDKGILLRKIDAVFVNLKDWADEWREKSAYFRD